MIRRIATLIGVVVVGFVIWATVGPASLHGPNHYMITSGTSMLPTIQPQSAVVVRHEDSYRVGQIVAYRNPDLGGAIVLHRIIRRDGQRYVFKGDNNDAPDFYEPTAKQLVGAEVWSSHSLGRVVLHLRIPLFGAIMFGLIALWIMWPDPSKEQRRRSERGETETAAAPELENVEEALVG